MITKVIIYGERCSGTNYLKKILELNFDIEFADDTFGHKHFFGWQGERIKKWGDDILFICIVRNIHSWLNSFYRDMHHLPIKYTKQFFRKKKVIHEFLNKEFWSYHETKGPPSKENEIIWDRNLYTKERYKNIFELRHTKLKWMIEDLPRYAKNCILIKHEDLCKNFRDTLIKLKSKNLKVKKNINFPINTEKYFGYSIHITDNKIQQGTVEYNNIKLKKTDINIPPRYILKNPFFIDVYEKKLYNITASNNIKFNINNFPYNIYRDFLRMYRKPKISLFDNDELWNYYQKNDKNNKKVSSFLILDG